MVDVDHGLNQCPKRLDAFFGLIHFLPHLLNIAAQ